jgi:hypothetical protein
MVKDIAEEVIKDMVRSFSYKTLYNIEEIKEKIDNLNMYYKMW